MDAAGGGTGGVARATSNARSDRLIMEKSCFAKTDAQGTPLERYLGHSKIFEDEPGESSGVKERYIILSLRSADRTVMVHKAKRHSNGAFGIGKSWELGSLQKLQDMDELSCTTMFQKPYVWRFPSAAAKQNLLQMVLKTYATQMGHTVPNIIGIDPDTGATPFPRSPARQSSQKALATGGGVQDGGDSSRPPIAEAGSPVPSEATSAVPKSVGVPVKSPLRSNTVISKEGVRQASRVPRQGPMPTILTTSAQSNAASTEQVGPSSPSTGKASEIESAHALAEASLVGRPSQNSDQNLSLRSSKEKARAYMTDEATAPPSSSSDPARRLNTAPEGVRLRQRGREPQSAARSVRDERRQSVIDIIGDDAEVPKSQLDVSQSLRGRARAISNAGANSEASTELMSQDHTQAFGVVSSVLDSFDWTKDRAVDRLCTELGEELQNIEGESIKVFSASQAPGAVKMQRAIDDAVNVVAKLKSSLSYYTVLLGQVAPDITHIETQNKGLQVKSVNQKRLLHELDTYLKAIESPSPELSNLQQISLDAGSIPEIETQLLALYRTLRSLSDLLTNSGGESPAAEAGFLKYSKISDDFLRRLQEYLNIKIQAELQGIRSDNTPRNKISSRLPAYEKLSVYAGCLQYAKEINSDMYMQLQRLYVSRSRDGYQQEVDEMVAHYVNLAAKSSPTDSKAVSFTAAKAAINSGSGLSSLSLRSATLRRTGTVARSVRAELGMIKDKAKTSSSLEPSQAVASICSELVKAFEDEMAFAAKFFNISLSATDMLAGQTFPDMIGRGNVSGRDTYDALRGGTTDVPKEIARLMLDIFQSTIERQQQRLLSVSLTSPIQMVGIIIILETYKRETLNTRYGFLTRLLMDKLHESAVAAVERAFRDDVAAIEQSRHTVRKKRGYVWFIRVFANMSERIEDQFEAYASGPGLPIEQLVETVYEQVTQAMFDTVKTIARGSMVDPSLPAFDPEDKEELNYHIIMVQNTYEVLEEVQHTGRSPALAKAVAYARFVYEDHRTMYLKQMLRRPMAKFMDFVDASEAYMKTGAKSGGAKEPYTAAALRRLLAQHESKDIRRGIKALVERMEKHFSDEDAPITTTGGPGSSASSAAAVTTSYRSVSQSLLAAMLQAAKREYVTLHQRATIVLAQGFPSYGLSLPWGLEDVSQAFKRAR